MEQRVSYEVLTTCDTLDGQRPLSTRNLEQLQRDLEQLERMLTPLLNQVRAMQGKKPLYVLFLKQSG